jgi:hypothetical protein
MALLAIMGLSSSDIGGVPLERRSSNGVGFSL